jgi:hypothetical protein
MYRVTAWGGQYVGGERWNVIGCCMLRLGGFNTYVGFVCYCEGEIDGWLVGLLVGNQTVG